MAKGGEGGLKLAEEVIRLCDEPNDFHYCYEEDTTIQEKLDQIVQKVYGGRKAVLTPAARNRQNSSLTLDLKMLRSVWQRLNTV